MSLKLAKMGFLIMLLGISAADSPNLIIPFLMMGVGVTLFYIGSRGVEDES